MITPNIQLGSLLTRGGGQAIEKGLGGGGASCPGWFILPPAQNFRQNW